MLLILHQIKIKLIEWSACKLKVRGSEISGNCLPVPHSFRHGGMWFLFIASVRFLNDLGHSGHCSLVHLKPISTWVQPQNEHFAIAPECFSGALGNQREHMVTAAGSSFWWTGPAQCFPIQGTVHFSFTLHLLNCDTDSLMGCYALLLLLCTWNWMVVFFRGMGSIFVQDEGNWTAWVSIIWERKLILGRLK